MMEGWKTDKFKNQIQYKSGYTWSKEQELKTQEPNSVRVLTVTNIQKDLDLSEELYLQGVSEKDKKEKAVSKDWCIAVSSNGNRKRIGNAVFIKEGFSQIERLEKLNKIAIEQMKILENIGDRKLLR